MSTRVQVPKRPATGPVRPFTPTPFGTLQRKCACGGSGGSAGECESCQKKKLQRQASGGGPETAPPIVHDALRSPGQPLDRATRNYFEPRFGHDFGKVRIHADRQAAESAQAVNAFAYTVGQNIFFAPERYAPGTAEGNRLLAHELTHTVQQSQSGVSSQAGNSLAIGSPADSSELEANAVADRLSASAGIHAQGPVASVHRSAMPGAVVQRECDGKTPTTCSGKCTTASGRVGKCIFNSMPRWCKCMDTAYLTQIPAWLLALLGAAAVALLIACFATGVCEFGALVGGLGAAAAAALIAILRKAGVQDSGTTASAGGSTDGSQPGAGSPAAGNTDTASAGQAA
jgi:hypothetical protein